jgi:Tol biopolymer transport system component
VPGAWLNQAVLEARMQEEPRRFSAVHRLAACVALALAAGIVALPAAPRASADDRDLILFVTDRAANLLSVQPVAVSLETRARRPLGPPILRVDSFARSADGKLVAFLAGQELSIRATAGGAVRALTGPNLRVGPLDAAFSPRGDLIAFSAHCVRGPGCGVRSLYVVRADGSAMRRIGQGVTPSWSPRGRRLTYATVNSANEPLAIEVARPDGSGRSRVASGAAPVWAPRGELIAFSVGGPAPALRVVNVRTRQVTTVARGFVSNVVWGRSGRSLAFTRDSSVYVVRADARGLSRLTHRTTRDSPDRVQAWSVDGARVAFVRDATIYAVSVRGAGVAALARETRGTRFSDLRWRRNFLSYGAELPQNDPELAVLDLQTAAVRTLTHNEVADVTPSWSPDGRKVVFARASPPADRLRLFVTNSDGSGARPLIDPPADGFDYFPAWSPDGKRIAFLRQLFRGSLSLQVMDADGSDVRTISAPPVYVTRIAWSPDSSRLAFTGLSFDRQAEIFSVALDGSALRQLTHRPSATSPSWSRNGASILFDTDRGDQLSSDRELHAMAPDGSNERRIARAQGGGFPGAGGDWSPDATRIVFSRDGDLYVADAASGDERAITSGLSSDVQPAWRP